jgi:hypothetical protein
VIDRRAAGLIDSKTMMDKLLNWKYTFEQVPRIDGVATDAYMSGDCDEIELAYYRDLLSDEEFTRLAERQKNLIERATRS